MLIVPTHGMLMQEDCWEYEEAQHHLGLYSEILSQKWKRNKKREGEKRREEGKGEERREEVGC